MPSHAQIVPTQSRNASTTSHAFRFQECNLSGLPDQTPPRIDYADASPELLRLCGQFLETEVRYAKLRAAIDRANDQLPAWAREVPGPRKNLPEWSREMLEEFGIPAETDPRPNAREIAQLNGDEIEAARKRGLDTRAVQSRGGKRLAALRHRVSKMYELCRAVGLDALRKQLRDVLEELRRQGDAIAIVQPASLVDMLIQLEVWRSRMVAFGWSTGWSCDGASANVQTALNFLSSLPAGGRQ